MMPGNGRAAWTPRCCALVNRKAHHITKGEKMRLRIIAMLASCLLTIGFGSFLAASPSFASGGFQYCSTGTSWNGGPEVKADCIGDLVCPIPRHFAVRNCSDRHGLSSLSSPAKHGT